MTDSANLSVNGVHHTPQQMKRFLDGFSTNENTAILQKHNLNPQTHTASFTAHRPTLTLVQTVTSGATRGSMGFTQFYLPPTRLSTNRISHSACIS